MTEQRKKLIIVSIIFFAVIVAAYFILWHDTAPTPPAPTSDKQQNAAVQSDVVIYISGGVIKPGVYKMGANARVIDAVNAAGGLSTGANPGAVNMAQLCADGMHIIVPVKFNKDNAVSPSVNPNGTTAMDYSPDMSLNNNKVSINTAGKTELAALPGIGDALAQRIIDYRSKNGNFANVEDLKKVSGIGDARFNKIRDQIIL